MKTRKVKTRKVKTRKVKTSKVKNWNFLPHQLKALESLGKDNELCYLGRSGTHQIDTTFIEAMYKIKQAE